jgi:hypothetical protein
MVEDNDRTRDNKEHFWQSQLVLLSHGNCRFKETRGIVAEEADSTADETRKFWPFYESISRHQLAKFHQWVGGGSTTTGFT